MTTSLPTASFHWVGAPCQQMNLSHQSMTVIRGIIFLAHCLKLRLATADQFHAHPNGYWCSLQHPLLHGENHCPYCLCAPCIIQLPPDFLQSSAGPHLANDEKRPAVSNVLEASEWPGGMERWAVFSMEARTSIFDKREIIPHYSKCTTSLCMTKCNINLPFVLWRSIQEIRSRYPSLRLRLNMMSLRQFPPMDCWVPCLANTYISAIHSIIILTQCHPNVHLYLPWANFVVTKKCLRQISL